MPEAPQPTGRLAGVAATEFDLAGSVGGVRGVIETVVPVTLFSAVFGVTRDLQSSVIAAIAASLIFCVARVLARQPVTQAVSGLVAIGLGAFVASRTGEAKDVFLPSLIKNAAFAAVYASSILLRWPVIGVLLGFVYGEGFAWREDRRRLAAYQAVTWVWVGLFAVRLLVMTPLYLAGYVATLGIVTVFLGLPLFGVTLWLSWLILRNVPPTKPKPVPVTVEPRPESAPLETAPD